MTLTEYLNLSELPELKSTRVGEVILNDSEVQIVRTMKRIHLFSYTIVHVPTFGYSYMIIEGSNNLRTMDADGNPKGFSVFSYKLPNLEIN